MVTLNCPLCEKPLTETEQELCPGCEEMCCQHCHGLECCCPLCNDTSPEDVDP
jgi:hypothetical protein